MKLLKNFLDLFALKKEKQGINGKEFALKIPEILLKGKIEKVSGNDDNKRLNFRYKDGVVVLKKENGNNHWIITAFIKEDGGRSVIDHSAYALQNPEISSVKGASNSEQSENFSENQEENAKYSNYVYSKRIDFKKFSNSFSSSLTV